MDTVSPTVSVWRMDLADPRMDPVRAARRLTVAERRRADRGTPAVRRRRVLLRAGLRTVLADLLGVHPAEVPIALDDGRPHLASVDPSPRIGVSCSASGDVGLVAVARGARLGVDVEEHRDADARAAADEGWLAGTEQSALRLLPEDRRLRATTRCWTQKEAVLKGRGVGLRQAPAGVVTPVADSGWVGDWWVVPVPVPLPHVATLALEGSAVPAVPVCELFLGETR